MVIPLRDGDVEVWARAIALETAPYISILTAAELEGGVYRDPANAVARRAALDALAGKLDILPFDEAELAAYRAIIEAVGFNRARVLDRLIAATALAHDLALATRNPKDFRDVPGLAIEVW